MNKAKLKAELMLTEEEINKIDWFDCVNSNKQLQIHELKQKIAGVQLDKLFQRDDIGLIVDIYSGEAEQPVIPLSKMKEVE